MNFGGGVAQNPHLKHNMKICISKVRVTETQSNQKVEMCHRKEIARQTDTQTICCKGFQNLKIMFLGSSNRSSGDSMFWHSF